MGGDGARSKDLQTQFSSVFFFSLFFRENKT